MKGINEYIAVILILLISVSIVSAFYIFIYGTQTTIQESIKNQTSEIQKYTGSKMKIINVLNIGSCSVNITILNSGIYDLKNFYIYVNNIPQTNIIIPNILKPGEIGLIKINLDSSFEGKEIEIKITTQYTSEIARKKFSCASE